jgi:large subunit ribosomal protein L25
MATVLEAKTRKGFTKSSNKKIRGQGKIPAVLYGNDAENQSIYVDNSDFIKVIRKVGRNGVITLKIEGDNNDYPVMMYDVQTDRIKDQLVHLDFYKVDMKSEVDTEVTVHLKGEAAGQKDGGVVQHLVREISVRALPADIPESIDVNIENLNIGDSVQISDLKKSSSYEILDDGEEVIISITPPQEEEPEEEEEDDEEKEPELVGGDDDAEEEDK